MTGLDATMREALRPLRDLELDDGRLARAAAAAAAAGPARTPARRAAGIAAGVAGAGAIGAVLGVLVVATPDDPPAAQRGGPAPAPAPAAPIQEFPPTPRGRAGVEDLFRRMASAGAPLQVRIATVRPALQAQTPHGTYVVWTARTRDPRGRAAVISSPRIGTTPTLGRGRVLRPGAGIAMMVGVMSRTAKAREMYGIASPEVVRVVADLRDGRRVSGFAGGGWFVFTQDIGHAPPVRLTAYDAADRRVGRPQGLLPAPVPAPRTAPAPTPSP